jgi:hypothetical protein
LSNETLDQAALAACDEAVPGDPSDGGKHQDHNLDPADRFGLEWPEVADGNLGPTTPIKRPGQQADTPRSTTD